MKIFWLTKVITKDLYSSQTFTALFGKKSCNDVNAGEFILQKTLKLIQKSTFPNSQK